MSSSKLSTFAAELSDSDLEAFHGGVCTITYNYDDKGNITSTQVSNECQGMNITINVNVNQS